MARNTLEAVFGALGAGLTGYGRDVARRREEEQARLDRERQAERDRLAMFEAGLEPSADVQGRRQRLTQATQATQAMAGAPMPGMSAVGSALAAATRAMGEDVDRGRRITIGGTEYVQPFSRTLEGREQAKRTREAQQEILTRQREEAALDRQRKDNEQALIAAGVPRRDAAALAAAPLGTVLPSFLAQRLRPAPEDPMQSVVERLSMTRIPDQTSPDGFRYLGPEEIQDRVSTIRQVLGGQAPMREAVGTGMGGAAVDIAQATKNRDEAIASIRANPRIADKDAAIAEVNAQFERDTRQTPPPVSDAPVTEPAAPPQANDEQRIRSLRDELRELERGKRGTIKAREQYQANEPRREALRLALEEAGYRYANGTLVPIRR